MTRGQQRGIHTVLLSPPNSLKATQKTIFLNLTSISIAFFISCITLEESSPSKSCMGSLESIAGNKRSSLQEDLPCWARAWQCWLSIHTYPRGWNTLINQASISVSENDAIKHQVNELGVDKRSRFYPTAALTDMWSWSLGMNVGSLIKVAAVPTEPATTTSQLCWSSVSKC